MWRPKDWKNPHIGNCCPEGGCETCEIDAYEAGADAMLEALRKQGGHTINEQGVGVFPPQPLKTAKAG